MESIINQPDCRYCEDPITDPYGGKAYFCGKLEICGYVAIKYEDSSWGDIISL